MNKIEDGSGEFYCEDNPEDSLEVYVVNGTHIQFLNKYPRDPEENYICLSMDSVKQLIELLQEIVK